MIFYLISFVSGFLLGFKIKRSKKTKVNDNRRGLLKKEFTSSSPFGKKEEFEVVFEVEEVESSETRSKVHVIGYVSSKSDYNEEGSNNIYKEKVTSMIEGSWILSSQIEWIDSKSKIRMQKIEDILN